MCVQPECAHRHVMHSESIQAVTGSLLLPHLVCAGTGVLLCGEGGAAPHEHSCVP
jgi:hypothetical protein